MKVFVWLLITIIVTFNKVCWFVWIYLNIASVRFLKFPVSRILIFLLKWLSHTFNPLSTIVLLVDHESKQVLICMLHFLLLFSHGFCYYLWALSIRDAVRELVRFIKIKPYNFRLICFSNFFQSFTIGFFKLLKISVDIFAHVICIF